MLIVGTAIVVLVALVATLKLGLFRARASVTLIAFGLALPALALAAPLATAADVVDVPLGTASGYSVLGATTVTNTGSSVLAGSVGLSPGSSVTGFPPGIVTPPAIIDTTPAADQAQSDLTTAYVDAGVRPVTATTTADLVGLNLSPGVYSGPDKSALGLTGTLTLDAGGNADAVFIFQTDSTLITASSSTIALVNGAQACHVYWQVGSSATLGTGSVFVGTILAQASVTVDSNVTVHGRALARTGAVTLDDDTFTDAGCAPTSTTTTSGSGSTTSSSTPGGPTTTVQVGPTTTVQVGPTTTVQVGPTTTVQVGPTTTTGGSGSTTTSSTPAGPTTTVQVGSTTTTPGTGSTTVPSGPSATTTTSPTSLVTQTRPSGPSTSTGTGMTGGTLPNGHPRTPRSSTQLAETGWPTAPILIVAGLLVTIGLITLLIGREHPARR
jgi:hypothetical protein